MSRNPPGYWIHFFLLMIAAALVGALSPRLKVYGSVVYVSASFIILLAFYFLAWFISSKLQARKHRQAG